MKPADFVAAYKGYALQTQSKTGIPALVILAQAALESGWGRAAPGNMFFGVKDTDGLNGNEQLITTTEYLRRADVKFPEVISITPVVRNGQKWFKYKVKEYFRKYNSPEECFTHHALFLLKNKRYAQALKVKDNPYAFIEALAKAGYATAPDYAKTVKLVAKTIERYL
jgi:flagellum-specific peptidoglycan hydrolase FlgJ